MMFLVCGCLNKNIKTNAVYCKSDVVKSPTFKNDSTMLKAFLNEGSTSITTYPMLDISLCIKTYDGEILCQCFHLPEKGRLDKIKKRKFAVLIDSSREPIDYQFLQQQENYEFLMCYFKIPLSSNYLEIHVYGQDEKDPNFLLREENFLCKSKFLSCYSDFIYLKQTKECVSYYDRDGNIAENKLDLYQMLLPRFFCYSNGI